ncbi:hypothetical protein AMATHDRAFT_9586 [Amanita thiersii Skay4041]|uniref:Retrovirus-related Pol polyprotein from transposon TNT 1-94-like beta-barrel domain-containing protein n=1 Tax=Amanita thiersii Skay4041 TaxID=703135 RepID=A0A2A9N7A1_9AGAR|nr:hypothetical protein AMATHDRAFT_9586 [Amanita thiersii Skay4041]
MLTTDETLSSEAVKAGGHNIKVANGEMMYATGHGDMKAFLPMGKDQMSMRVTLKDVLYSPQFSFTLISVSQMDQNGFGIKMVGGICTITTPEPNSHIIGHIPEVQGLYCVSLATKHAHTEHTHLSSTKISISDLHH